MAPTAVETARFRPSHPLRRLLESDVAMALFVVAFAVALCAFAVRGPDRIDHLTVTNPTAYDIEVEVNGGGAGATSGWMPVAVVGAGNTLPLVSLIDQGDSWTFRFTGQGHVAGTQTLTADQLRQDGWKVVVGNDVADQMSSAGLQPTPIPTTTVAK